MISSFVLNLHSLEEGKEIKKYQVYKDIFSMLIQEGVTNEELKYITISNFFSKDRYTELDKKYSLRVACINSNVTLKILQVFFYKRLTNSHLDIYESKFLVSNIYHNNKHSKIFDLEKLLESPLKKQIRVKFLTPTFFKVGNDYRILKDPIYIFKNILNKLKKSSLSEEVKFSKNLEVSKIKMKENHFKEVNIFQYKTSGFIGEFIYYLEDDNVELMEYINILLYFAFFSGVGYGCERGYGQIEADIVIEETNM